MKTLTIFLLAILLVSCKKESNDVILTPYDALAGHNYQIGFSNGDYYILKFTDTRQCEVIPEQNWTDPNGYMISVSCVGTLESFTMTLQIVENANPYIFKNCRFLDNGCIVSDYKDVITPDYTIQRIQ
jgi:hypothetical protein